MTDSIRVAGVIKVRDLDLASLDSVRAFAAKWDGGIDLPINNAGVSPPSLARIADGFQQYNNRTPPAPSSGRN